MRIVSTTHLCLAKRDLSDPLLVKQYISFLVEWLGRAVTLRDMRVVALGPLASLALAVGVVVAAGRGPARVDHHPI